MYLGDLPVLVPILNLCRDDTGEPTNRGGPRTGYRASVRKSSGRQLEKIVIKQLATVPCESMSQTNQHLGKLTGLVVPKSWEACYTCTMVAVTYGLTAKSSGLARLKKDLAVPNKVYLCNGFEFADKSLQH